jgi:hypothetical protein
MEMTASGLDAAGRKRSETRQRTALVALRLLPGERDQLTTAARNRNVSLSELIRTSALDAITAHGTEQA